MATGHFTGVTHGYRSSNYRVGDGSESTPSYSFISDQDTGIYRPVLDLDGSTAVENTIGFVSGGGEVFRLTAEGHVAFIVDEAIIRGGTTGFGVMNYDADEYNFFVDDSGGATVRYGLEVLDGGLQIDAGGLTVTAGTVSLPTGSITSAMILDGTIVNADINASAAIDASKLNSGTFGGSGVYTFPAAMAVTTIAYVNDTSNANMTIGLTINQGANDDEAIALKSSDIAHGVTSVAETDTYGVLKKFSATDGGLDVVGFGEAWNGVHLSATVTTEDNGRTTSAVGAILLDAYLKSGTGRASMSADRNMFTVRNNGSSKLVVDSDGDLHLDAVSNNNVWDEWDDVALVRAFDRLDGKQAMRTQWDEFVQYRKDDLIAAGIIAPDGPDGARGLLNFTNLVRLHNGALWQLQQKLWETEQQSLAQIGALEQRLMQLEAARG